MRCCKFGCKNTNLNSKYTKFHLVPKHPKIPNCNSPKKSVLIRQAGKILLRREIMDRTMSDRSNKTSKVYVCDQHRFEEVAKSTCVKLNNGEVINVTYSLIVPCGAGPKSTMSQPKSMSLGTGNDRNMKRQLSEMFGEDTLAHRTWALCAQQLSEQSCPEQHIPINASVAAAAHMPIKNGNATNYMLTSKQLFRAIPITATKVNHRRTDDPPVVRPGLPNSEVKRRTGFPSEEIMLSFIITVCNGDLNTIKQKHTCLTWYEEWFLYFEYVWNRSLTRIEDVSKTYSDMRRNDVLRVVDAKLDLCTSARNKWPKFVSYEEDRLLRKPKWNSRYEGMHPIMWDMTNVSAYAFSSAHWQRLTYSQYYNENCFKSGVFCQTCGWMGVVDLWLGGVSDSDFNRREGYLEEQRLFQEKDKVVVDGQETVIPFLNIYDKGYCAKMAAWQNGRQLVLQPDFKKSDKKFNRSQTISSASVATDRGGNERVVNVSKRAGLISRGFQPNADPIRFNKVWTTWAFQANFMFDPVL